VEGVPEMPAKELLAAVVESSDDAIFAKSLDGTILSWNAAAEHLYGYSREEAVGRSVELLVPQNRAGEHDEILARIRRGERVEHFETRRRRKDGTEIDVSVTISPIIDGAGRVVGASSVARDIGSQRHIEELQRRLTLAQKAEAIGSLAAGVAHDFNNVLMVVRACSALLLKRVSDEAARRDVDQIDEAARRGAELTRQLLAFSLEQADRPELTDVNVVVDQTLELLRRVIGDQIEIELDLEPELPPILVDRSRLGQVIVNLAINARDAMPDGGTLALVTRVAGLEVLLRVSDTGIGMGEETRERIFDPFFTTKDSGTGLGLANVRDIVVQSRGRIELESVPGRGTTFELAFPAAEAPRAVPAVEGGETILFVEDEETVRVLVAETLRAEGYTVVEAGSGAEAVRIASDEGAIDLLLTDVTLPGMDGHELAGRLAETRPGLRVVYTSGYPPRPGDPSPHLQKPYASADLAATVRRVLDAPRAA